MNQKSINLLLAAVLLSSAQLSAMNNNGNMFHQGYERRLNRVREPLDNFIAALEHCEGQLDAQRQENTLQSVQDILGIVKMVNGQCQEAFNLFIQNEEIRNEFFLLQQNANSAQKIKRMSDLFTQISQRLQNLSTQFSLLDMTSSDGQENFDRLKIALAQFLTYRNQVNDLLAGKQISIDNELDTSAVEIEIIPDTENDEQIAQALNLEENMALMPELRQTKPSQQEQPVVLQPNKSTDSKKRKFEALVENKEFTPNKFPKHNEIVNSAQLYEYTDSTDSTIRKPLDHFIDALKFCNKQLDSKSMQLGANSMKVEDILVILNEQCQEAFNLFTQNEEIRNEFFLLQQNAKSAQKIKRLSNLFTQISERLQFYSSFSHPFPDELFSQFLIYHNQVNEVLASKEISINNQIDNELNTNEIINNIEDTIQLQPADENEFYESVNLPTELWVEIILNQAAINFIQKIAEEYSACGDHSPYTFQKLIQRFAQEVLYKLNATCKLFHDITKPVLNELKELLKVYPDVVPADPREILNKVNDRLQLTCDDLTTQNIRPVVKKFLKQVAYFIPIQNFDLMINRAVRNNNEALVSCFIAGGKNRKYSIPINDARHYDKDHLYINALHVAVSHDNENMVRLLLDWKNENGDLVIDPRVSYCNSRNIFNRGAEENSFDLALNNQNVPIVRLFLDLRDAQGTQLINPNEYDMAKLTVSIHDTALERELLGLSFFDLNPKVHELAELLREYGVTE